MPTPNYYPAFLDLTNVPVLVVGGGSVAVRKARELITAKANVTLIAKEFTSPAKQLKKVIRRKRGFQLSDIKGKQLVFAATDDAALNRTITTACKKARIWVNSATNPESGNVIIPSLFRRGSLTVAFSSGGISPAATAAIRRKLEKQIGPEWKEYLRLIRVRRKRILASNLTPPQRRRLLQSLGQAEKWTGSIRRQSAKSTAAAMDKMISSTLNQTQ